MNLSVREAARLLNASEREVYRWIREGSIPHQRVGDRYRFHRAELLEWATSRGIRVAPSEFQAPDAANGAPSPSLSHALERGGIHYAVPGVNCPEVLRAVVERMPIDPADREEMVDFLLAREALGSTGVGEGIAIPHARNPVVLHVEHPLVTLCFFEKAVDFDAVDGQPVHTVFTLVTRTIRSHLYLLSRISASLHDAEFKRSLGARAPAEKILAETRRVEAEFARKARART
jgi:PTS system nitrogen regulatory IIA component